jgi:haloalkane dehalogenase
MPSVDLLDSEMHYRETGAGRPFVFLHGNPTSSYLWRNVLPGVGDPAWCLAPDLIGMGDSGKPDIDYRFADHARYLDAWFDQLELEGVVLIGHDWGGALAFDWARRHPDRVSAVAFLETILRPMTWDAFPESGRPIFDALRTPGRGEQMVLEENLFIEQALPGAIRGGLAEADHNVYRAPYPTVESRRPLLQWPREMPLGGEPADVVERVEAYDRWLADSRDVPKLLLTFDPGQGIMVGPELVAWCENNVAALEAEHCGVAGHHAPEDRPGPISAAISGWADRHELRA